MFTLFDIVQVGISRKIFQVMYILSVLSHLYILRTVHVGNLQVTIHASTNQIAFGQRRVADERANVVLARVENRFGATAR